MSRDVIIALIGSILLHAGFVFGGQFFKAKPEVKIVQEETPTMELIPLPPVEPEQTEVVESAEASADVADLAPPMQADLPSAVMDSPFVQQIQPPPPPGMSKPTGTIAIPAGRPAGGLGSGLKNVFDLASLDQRPVPTFQPKPVHPFELKRAGIAGEATLGFIVDSNGNVRDPYVISSSHREFEATAIDGVLKWKFRPGKKSGAAVNTRVTIKITFPLNAK